MCTETGATAHRAQTISCHRYPSSPLLSPVQQPPRAQERETGKGGFSLSLFLSLFHFLPPCFCNLSSAVSPSLTVTCYVRGAGRRAACLPTCLSVCLSVCLWWERFLRHAVLFFFQLDKNRGRRLWIRHAHDSFALLQRKDVISDLGFFLPPSVSV